MAWNESIITVKGINLAAELMNGGSMEITKAEVGESITDSAALAYQRVIRSPINVPVSIVKKKKTENGIMLSVQIKNAGAEKAYKMRQLGIYARTASSEETLFAILQSADGEEIPSEVEYPNFLLEFTANIAMSSNTDNITVVTNPATIIVTTEILKSTMEEYSPAYINAEKMTELSSGEKLSTALGKIAYAVKSLIEHIGNKVKHITAAERTAWNGKAAANHTHTYVKELVPTKNENNEVDLNKLIVGDSVGFWKIDSRQYTVLNAPTAFATQGLLVAVDFENGGFGEQYFSPYSSNTRYFRSYYYDNSKVVFGSWYKIFDGANAAAALKLANARKINGVGFDGTADVTITAAANGGNAQTVNGHTVLSDVPANAKYTDTTYSAATATADGLMSKEDKSKLDAAHTNLSAHISDNVKHITATERAAWNGKAGTSVATTTANGLMSKEDKSKLDNTSANLSTHTSDNVKHITAAERTAWNGKAAANHTHTYVKELVPTKNENNEVDLNKLIVGDSVGFWKIDSRQYTVLNAPTAFATQGLLVAVDFENGGFGEQYFSPYSSNTRYFRGYNFDGSKIVFGSWYKIFDGANAAAALKLANARKINGVGFDGTADVTITAAANGGNAQTVNGHTVLSDVPANAKYTDTTYSAATATADGLMSKEDKAKLDTYPATYSAVKGEKGDKGDTGARGSKWYTGTNVTGLTYMANLLSGDEKVNDMYLNTSTGEIFQCTEVSNQVKWVRKCILNLVAKG